MATVVLDTGETRKIRVRRPAHNMAPTKLKDVVPFRLTDAIADLHACVGEGETAISQAVSVTRQATAPRELDLLGRQ